ncbi:MAG: hypothetical protein WA584_06685 [Pyrinomonadaceae bacterium]
MKNKYLLLTAAAILFISVLGCSYFNQTQSNSNKTLPDKAVDSTVGEEKIGIAECDEAFDDLTKLANNDEDDMLTKAGKRAALNKIRENLKQSIEKNKKDKTQQAKECREYKTQIDRFKTKESTNNSTNESKKF